MKRRHRRTGQPIFETQFQDHSKNLTHENPSSKSFGSLEYIRSRFFFVVIVALFIALIAAVYYAYTKIRQYLLARDVEAVANLVHPSTPVVGETLTCKIRFRRKESRKLIPSSSETFRELERNIAIEPHKDALTRSVAVLKEFNETSSHITGKFSLRKSGTYSIRVKYHTFDISPNPPITFEVLPGPVSPKYMDFDTHNTQILCVSAEFQQYFKILAEDEYGNRCRVQDVDLEKLDFQVYHMGNLLHVEHEFCYHNSHNNPINETTEFKIATCTVNICLKVKVNQPGIYTCFLKYGDYEIQSSPGIPKLLICISPEEETELRAMLSQIIIPGTLIFTNKCRLSFVGEEGGFKNYYTGISARSLVFAIYQIPLRLYPDIQFPIIGRTKIMLLTNQIIGSDNETHITIQVQDGLRPTVRLEMESSAGRMFLVVFGHNQGFHLPKLRVSFQEKRETLSKQLYSYFTLFRTERVLQIQAGNLINSTKKQVPVHQSDWLLPFRIQYEGTSPPLAISSISKVEEWINRLCDEFFKGQRENAMFQRRQGSKLLHPVSSAVSHQPIENYRLAGQILGKTIVETLLRGICTQLSQTRFTQTLLAFLLGAPISFKFLESDEPKYFRKIMSVVESDLTGTEYSFTTYPSSRTDASVVNLIPNGSDVPVTNANKEHYLNLLTKYRLIHTMEQEITAFRDGFYDVIDKDTLSDFHEQDLQKLISGGCEFKISDLKEHHRVVKVIDNGSISGLTQQSMETNKILQWFWIAVENLSEEEQSSLMFFSTGSFSLPSCGLSHLNPLFTISLTGSYNQPPKAHPASNEIVLGDHACFDSFERSLLYAIRPESERIMLPTTDILCLPRSCRANETNAQEEQETEVEEEWENTESPVTRSQDSPPTGDPILNWLRGFINL